MRSFIGLAILLLLLGLFFEQEVAVGLAWVLLGALVFTWLWQRRVVKKLKVRRTLPTQAFLDDQITGELVVGNGSRLPLPWLTLRESLPPELQPTPRPNWLLNLKGREQVRMNYTLLCKRRGRYLVGPTEGAAGVVFEPGSDPVGKRVEWPERSRLTVYPKIVPLEHLGLPSRLPLGDLKTRQPLLYDPSRIAGIRDYYPGDDPRHIDWRTSARLNTLQVKQFERTRQMPLAIFLDLKLHDYQYWRRIASEISIVVAASLAKRANELKQPFGLYSNGFDPAFRGWQELTQAALIEPGPVIPPRTGEAQLAEILDKLAGLQVRHEAPLLEFMLPRWTSSLTWGSTVAVIASEPTLGLAGELMRLRKVGYSPVAIFTATSDKPRNYQPKEAGKYSPADLRTLGLVVFEVSQAEELNALAGNYFRV